MHLNYQKSLAVPNVPSKSGSYLCILIFLIFLVLSGGAYAQKTDKTLKYIKKYQPSMNACFYTFLPDVFKLNDFVQTGKRDTLVSVTLPYENAVKLDTGYVCIYIKGLLKERWDYILPKLNEESKPYTADVFIKSFYSYHPKDSVLVIHVRTINVQDQSQYFTKILYSKDLLQSVEISKKEDQAVLTLNFKYEKGFISKTRTPGTRAFAFPFDSILVRLKTSKELVAVPAIKIRFSYYSMHRSGNEVTATYGSTGRYEQSYYDNFILIHELCFSDKLTSELSAFFLVGQIFEKRYIDLLDTRNDCKLNYFRNKE